MTRKETPEMSENPPRKAPRIPVNRRTAYNVGTVLTVLGVIVIVGSFATLLTGFGNMSLMQGPPAGFLWFFIGMLLTAAGAVVRRVAARGLAGSGVVLNPEQAREDLKPFTHAIGGALRDASEGFHEGGPVQAATQIMVRCSHCQALNPEEAKYCNQCGVSL